MTSIYLTSLIRKGLTALDEGNTLMALLHFEEAARWRPTPTVLSCLGYCLAREQRDLQKAFGLCREAIRQEPGNPLHYLNLGRVYLLARQKTLALKAFRKGLKFGRHQGLMEEIKKMGRRRPPVFSSLERQHLLNRYCGFFLSRLGMR